MLESTRNNDLYALLEIDLSFDKTDAKSLKKKYEELASRYDPVLFFFDASEQEAAAKKLEGIKSIFSSVFEKEASHKVYKHLCALRDEYTRAAKDGASSLGERRTSLKQEVEQVSQELQKAQMPSELLEETLLASELLSRA